ncbi:MAG TPA: hypothetical protein VGN18_06390 [Jatrophihabitans sp.]|jgi:hypothetical protein|uniref:hypothetical protein n=1 Tax=Jatrophihabitans sp. TaxID=1932789 RepID=UPI002E05C568|nr:hypothetical protein [Jatrophihabitans sp.]
MNDITETDQSTPTRPRRTRTGLKIALVGAGIAAGAIGATAIGAGATTAGSGSTAGPAATSSTGTAAPGAPSGAPAGAPRGGPAGAPQGGRPGDAHGAAPVRSDEKEVSGTTAATLRAAALKAVPGGTVYRVETDSGDAKYEVHMTRSDGTDVTVKFDANLKQTAVESGMGK